MQPIGWCFDIEADNLYIYAKQVWMIHFTDLNDKSKTLTVYPFREDVSLCKKAICDWNDQWEKPFIVGHNILGFDVFILIKFLGIPITVGKDTFNGKPCVFVDTFYMSMFTNPDRDGHSLARWGERLGNKKIDFHDFSQYTKEMDTYCKQDVNVNIDVFWYLWNEFTSYYDFDDELPQHYKSGQKSFYLMAVQAITGWEFDVEGAKALVLKIESMMKEIEDEVLPQLPPRPMNKGEQKEYTMPAKPFKKDGTFSSHMLDFIEKHNGKVVDNSSVEFYGKVEKVAGGKVLDVQLPMMLSNQDHLKNWLLEKGWVPTLWNYQRGPDGKPMRVNGKLIETTPKMQEAGRLCPNLEEMDGDLVKPIVKWLSLRNRLSVLQGWLEHPRLAIDNRLPTESTGITPSFRVRHSVVVNCPKASDKVILGKEFRSLFICRKGKKIAAGDAAALEGRVQGSYTFKYDNGATAHALLAGDPHSKAAKAFFPDETAAFDIDAPDFDKDDPVFKPYRDRSKNGSYALLYGCSPPKLAKTLGKPEHEGQAAYDAYWSVNPATKQLKDNVEAFWESKGQKSWLPAIDGRRLITRKKSALLNTLFQSCGAIIMEYALNFMDMWLGGIKWDNGKPYYAYNGYVVERVGFFHDELEYECDEEVAEEVAKMIEKAIAKAGQFLKLSIPFEGEGKVGNNWKEVH